MSQGTAMAVKLKGAHEVHLLGDHSNSFFSKRHEPVAPFAREPRIFTLPHGQMTWDRKYPFTIDRIGDLHGQAWLVVDLPALNAGAGGARYVENIAAHYFRSITMKVGHVTYQVLTPEIMDVMQEITTASDKETQKLEGIARDPTAAYAPDTAVLEAWATKPQRIYIPLDFSHVKHPGHYFPAVASYMSPIEFVIETRRKDEVAVAVGASGYNPLTDAGLVVGNVQLLTEIFLLDEYERESFGNHYLSYIFLQYKHEQKAIPAGSRKLDWEIKLSHTVRSYYFIFRKRSDIDAKNYGIFSGEEPATNGAEGHAFKTFKMKLNSVDRCEELCPLYMHKKTFEQVHTRVPNRLIYCFPNCFDAEAIDYNGGTNHSKLDTCTFQFVFSAPLSVEYQVDLIYICHNVSEFEKGVFRVLFGG